MSGRLSGSIRQVNAKKQKKEDETHSAGLKNPGVPAPS